MPKPERQRAPATTRNREPILEVMRRVLPEEGLVLEIASGTGEHAAWFSARLPELAWQPSDVSDAALESIEAWREEGSAKLRAPIRLDVRSDPWPVDEAQAIVNINMIHISPWEACKGLLRGAGRVLAPDGPLLMYGPYRLAGRHTAPSNESFDASLRERNPEWGVRNLDDVVAEAERNGLAFSEKVAMPANNFTVLFRRA
jgi:SAM-dependent methyltransferase